MSALRTSVFALALLLGCSDDKLSGSSAGGSGGNGTTSTSSTTQTGGAGGTTASGGTGGMTQSGGAGGVGGSTQSGGTGGTTASGGTGGVGGMTGSGGTGGMTGSGGAGGAPATGTLLALAGGVPGSLAQVVKWDASNGWTPSSINLQFKKAALAPIDGGVLMVARRLGNNPPMGDDDLFRATWTPAAGFGAVQSMNAVAIDGPALAPHGVATLLATLDATHKHVFAQYEAGAFGPFGAVPAGQPGSQAFGPSGPSLAAFGVASVYMAYSGDDGHVYMTSKAGPGSQWATSQQAPTSLVVNTETPAIVVDADGDLRFFYIRSSDGRLCSVTMITPQNAWSMEEVIHQDAITGLAPSAALLPGGDLLVAWHGFNNQGIYFSRWHAGVWSAPVTIEVAAMSASAPLVLTGLGGADAEVLYTADGKLRWARVTGMTATFGPDPAVFNVKAVAAIVLP